jgi:energy-coupling factor transporter ATP-binding protein EcfA2
MRFKSFTIKNFKGIENLTINLSSSPNSNVYTLVGLNESGKTTILEAISLFGIKYKSEYTFALEKNQEDIHNVIPISKIDNFNGKIELSGTIALEENDYAKIKEDIRKTLDINLTKEIKQFTLKQVYSFHNSIYDGKRGNFWSVDLVGKKGKARKEKEITGKDWGECYNIFNKYVPEILYFPNFLFEFPDKIFLEGNNDKQHEFYRSLIQDILDSLDNKLDISEHLVERIRKDDIQAKRHLDSVLLKMSNKVSAVIFGAWNRIFNKHITKKEIQISYGIEKEDNGTSKIYLQFFLRDGDGIYKISERSLGFRWFFVFLLLTQFRNTRTRQSRQVLFLFDEPASNLHSTAQAQLLQSFGKLSNVIYTTHSHHLVNPLWLENTYVVKNDGLSYDEEDDQFNSRKTNVTIQPYRQFVVKHPNQTNYFQPILDVLEYYPSVLENVPDVVITEGKNDYYTIHYMHNIIRKNSKLKIMPGTSAAKLDTPIQLYISWGRKFVVLLDADKAGIAQQKRYKELFGIIVENAVFTLLDVNPSWRDYSCEDLFSDNDKMALIRSKHDKAQPYDKSLFNRIIQENLINKKEFSFDEETLKNFTILLDFLEGHI